MQKRINAIMKEDCPTAKELGNDALRLLERLTTFMVVYLIASGIIIVVLAGTKFYLLFLYQLSFHNF